MLLTKVTENDAELYLKNFFDSMENSTPDVRFQKHLCNSGVKRFSSPFQISWEITKACNLKCKHCCFAGQSYDNSTDVSSPQALDFVQQLVDNDLVKIMLTGGEPFLRQDIFEIIRLLKSRNVIIQITTNATLITEEIAKNLGALFNPLSDYVQVSIDGATAKTHEQTRGKNTFNKALEGIRLLLKHGVNVTINCVVTKHNLHEMVDLYDLAYELGVSKVMFTRVFTEYDNNLLPDYDKLFKETIKLLKHEKDGLKLGLRLFTLPDLAANEIFYEKFADAGEIKNFSCNRGEKIHIRNDGEVFLCLHASNNSLLSLGNIKDTTLEEIIESSKTNPLFGPRRLSGTKCNSCRFQYYCKAGCPVSAYIKNKDINTIDPICMRTC